MHQSVIKDRFKRNNATFVKSGNKSEQPNFDRGKPLTRPVRDKTFTHEEWLAIVEDSFGNYYKGA
jgi:hypothetical protein